MTRLTSIQSASIALALAYVIAIVMLLAACGSGGTIYRSCDEAREAGAAPLHEGDPGHSVRLDANRDGVACE